MFLVIIAFLNYLSLIITASLKVFCLILLSVICHCDDGLSSCLLSLSIVYLILRTVYSVLGFVPLFRLAFLLWFVVID